MPPLTPNELAVQNSVGSTRPEMPRYTASACVSFDSFTTHELITCSVVLYVFTRLRTASSPSRPRTRAAARVQSQRQVGCEGACTHRDQQVGVQRHKGPYPKVTETHVKFGAYLWVPRATAVPPRRSRTARPTGRRGKARARPRRAAPHCT
eukprot:1109798-Prymnesium_polylepis.1